MPECMVCGETDFEEHEGHYFCSTCNTQSQDVRVTMVEEEDFGIARRSGLIREETLVRKKKGGKYEGRPWSVYEAYTMIMKHQVAALIKLGAEKELEDVVFQLWASYLRKLNVAFADSVSQQTGVKFERQRDLFLGTTNKPKIKDVYGHKSRARNFGLSTKSAEKQMERDKELRALQNEEFYEGDNPLTATSTTATVLDYDDNEEEERWGRYRKDVNSTHIEKVKMSSTLSICWLGLMYTNPLTTGSDLLRWVKEKKVPYLDANALLDDDMKFYLNDWKCFGMGVAPSLDQLRYNAGNIGFYLNLKDFPDFPLEELVQKYIIQLDLPAEFHGYVMNLYKGMAVPTRLRLNYSCRRICDWENTAMSFIVIFIKLFFGLNDSNEMLLSECTKSLQEISECSRPLFVWTDWIQHMKNRMQFSEQIKLRKTDNRMVSECISSRITHKKDWGKSDQKDLAYNPNFRGKVGQPFVTLSQRWKAKDLTNSQESRHAIEHHHVESLTQDGDTYDDHFVSNLLEDSDDIGNNSQNSARPGLSSTESKLMQQLKSEGEQFRHCTIQHIISPETYITDLKDRLNDTDDPNEADNDDICSSIISNSFGPGAAGNLSRQQNNSSMETNESDEFEGIVARDIDKFENVLKRILEIKENMRTSLDFETEGKACLSYDWLLRICSFVNDGQPTDLQNHVMKFEIRSFTEPDDPGLSDRGKRLRSRLLQTNGRALTCKIRKK